MTATELIRNRADAAALANRLRDIPLLAVDTEFVRERTYHPRPCLLQLAWQDRVACVDLLERHAVDELGDVLFDRRTLKVFHAARQDLELFFAMFGQVPGPIYDTQIAGAMLGFPDQSGYGTLVQEILDVTLDKGHARTDWSRRPLNEAQIRYAIEDVLYLLPMHDVLESRLCAKGRQDWCREMFEELTDPALYRPAPENAWLRVKNWRQLDTSELARLQALAAWREEQAIERDRPRKWILNDDALIKLARSNPRTEADLGQISMPAAVRRRQGSAIVDRLATVDPDASVSELPADLRLSRAEGKIVSALGRLVDQAARDEKIAAPLLATRAELRALVAGQRDLRVLRGWRRDLVGARLLEAVESRSAQSPGKDGTSAATSSS